MYTTYNDIPRELWKKHVKGSSPKLLKHLMDELKGAKSISISFFYITIHFYRLLLKIWLKKDAR